MCGSSGRGWEGFGWTLVALGKYSERVDLMNKVGDARPPSETESHHQSPYNHEDVHEVHGDPTPS